MSDKEFDYKGDDILSNIEKLKAKYSDYGFDENSIQSIEKNIIRSDPNYNAFEADFANGFGDEPEDKPLFKVRSLSDEKDDFIDFEDVYSTSAAQEETAADRAAQPAQIISNSPEKAVKSEPVPVESKPVQQTEAEPVQINQQPVQQTNVEPVQLKQQPVQQKTGQRRQQPVNQPAPQKKKQNKQQPAQRNQTGKNKAAVQRRRPDGADYNENNEKKNRKNMKNKKKKSHKLRNAVIILLALAAIWSVMFAVDYMRVSDFKDPLFCIKTTEYSDGSKDCVCVFCKFAYHKNEDGSVTTSVMPWFVKSANADPEKAGKNGEDSASKSTISAPTVDNSIIVDIKIPGEFIDKPTEEKGMLDSQQQADGFKSAIVDENGDVTYSIGKADYMVLCKKYKEDTKTNLDALKDNEDFPSVKKVEYADDFSSVTLYVDKAMYENSLNRFVSESVCSIVGFYRAFVNESSDFEYVVKDIADGSVIS